MLRKGGDGPECIKQRRGGKDRVKDSQIEVRGGNRHREISWRREGL